MMNKGYTSQYFGDQEHELEGLELLASYIALAEIISKDIIKVNRYGVERYFCSEDHIQARNKANPVIRPRQSFDYGYGKCTKDGWVR